MAAGVAPLGVVLPQALRHSRRGAFGAGRRHLLLRRGQRRRAPGLRRDEVAELCTMSADYFARLERGDGPQPSEQMLAAIARGLRLTPDERDHLFLLAGYRTARRPLRLEACELRADAGHGRPGRHHRAGHGPAGETLLQTPSAVALLGERTHTGNFRSATFRWFTDPAERECYDPDRHDVTSRTDVALLRTSD